MIPSADDILSREILPPFQHDALWWRLLVDIEKPRSKRYESTLGYLVQDRKLAAMARLGLIVFTRQDPNVAALSDTYELTDVGRVKLAEVRAWWKALGKAKR